MAVMPITARVVGMAQYEEAPSLLPVFDKHRFFQSEQAKRLDFLRSVAEELDNWPLRQLPANYDALCWEAAQRLREQGAYLIEVGCRA